MMYTIVSLVEYLLNLSTLILQHSPTFMPSGYDAAGCKTYTSPVKYGFAFSVSASTQWHVLSELYNPDWQSRLEDHQ